MKGPPDSGRGQERPCDKNQRLTHGHGESLLHLKPPSSLRDRRKLTEADRGQNSSIRPRGPERRRRAACGWQSFSGPFAPRRSPATSSSSWACPQPPTPQPSRQSWAPLSVLLIAPQAHAPSPASARLVGTAPFRAHPDPRGHPPRDTFPATASQPQQPVPLPTLIFSMPLLTIWVLPSVPQFLPPCSPQELQESRSLSILPTAPTPPRTCQPQPRCLTKMPSKRVQSQDSRIN